MTIRAFQQTDASPLHSALTALRTDTAVQELLDRPLRMGNEWEAWVK